MFKRFIIVGSIVVIFVTVFVVIRFSGTTTIQWSPEQLATIQSLWIKNLPERPPAAGNQFAYDEGAAKLGQQIFFDPRFSANNQVSCATCHQPQFNFTDKKTLAEGLVLGERNTQSIVGSAYGPWFFWDGRKDSLWSQALAPLENRKEHGSNRKDIARIIHNDLSYSRQYKDIFGPFPNIESREGMTEIFVNVGKAIAAYENKLIPGDSRFDHYVDDLINHSEYEVAELLTEDEIRGLNLFIDKAQCLNCHNGPLFSNFSFHNTGLLPLPGKTPVLGRASATQSVLNDAFNCYSVHSDKAFNNCSELDFIKLDDENLGAQKTPSLRNLENTEPFMHAGQFSTLNEVLEHYNRADLALVGHNEAKPLNLSKKELLQLQKFLQSLQAPLATESHWLQAPEFNSDSKP